MPSKAATSRSAFLADHIFLGAGIRTVSRYLIWRDPEREGELLAPRFDRGAKVGTGSVILAGVTIGEDALVGAGSVVTRDVPPHSVAYGVPVAAWDGPAMTTNAERCASDWLAAPGLPSVPVTITDLAAASRFEDDMTCLHLAVSP